jgi:chromosomal replication initiator protein
MDNKNLWNGVLVDIELNVSKATFTTWFKNTSIVKQEDGTVFVSVPSIFVRDWILDKHHKFILRSLRNLSESIRAVEYVISKDDAPKRQDTSPQKPNSFEIQNKELPLSDLYINKDDNLNPRYTFETFVVGPFNELAHAAAQAIIKKPVVYNPLFIYGNTGHGKTHLLQAVGNHIKNQNREKRIFYVTSEKFSQDLVNSLQSNKMNQFKEKYRKYDVLIMDDIQFLSGKEKTQEELFHLFNTLYENNKQIIFSSDQHPNYIPNLEDRLKSRFVAGMMVDIPQPDHESRLAIIHTKAKQSGVDVPPEILNFLASSIEGNIRELEGVLNSIVCQTQLKGKELSLLDVKNLIKNTSKPSKNLSVKELVKIIAGFYNIEEDSIYDKSRRKEVVKPRQLTMYILREDFNVSYPSIGQKLGDRDHTTVIHSCEKIKNELKVNNRLVQELSQIRALI